MRWSVPLVPLALLLAACAGETEATTSFPAPTTSTIPVVTTAPVPTATAVPAFTTTTTQMIDVEIRDGEVTGPERFEVVQGEMVEIIVLSDTAYEIHVHGYDLRYDVEPGAPFTIEFIADVPGIFEVETHPGHLTLFGVEVGN